MLNPLLWIKPVFIDKKNVHTRLLIKFLLKWECQLTQSTIHTASADYIHGITFYVFLQVNINAASWQNQQNDMCAQQSLRSAWASAQSDQSLHCTLNG